jgi:hypothetical protein
MLKYLLLACFISLGFCHLPNIAVLEERMPNGDENEIVSIDLKKVDGTEDIKLMAQLRFHLNHSQVFVNGHPIIHNVVNSLRMRISIIEIEAGIQRKPRLAPVTFRVLVLETTSDNGNKQLRVEEEFVKVEQYEVLQVDIKQIVWEGSNRLPMTTISFQDSFIHRQPHEQDRRVFVTDPDFKPRLPAHGLKGDEGGYDSYHPHHHEHHKHHHRHHRHHRHHSRVLCWFSRLSIGGKIAVICAAVVTFLGLLSSLIICWKRHCHHRRNMHVNAPMDDFVEVEASNENDADKKDLTKVTTDDGQFHMEINACFVDVDDKKALVE